MHGDFYFFGEYMKKLLSLILSFLFVLSFALLGACANDTDNTDVTPPPSEHTEHTYGNTWSFDKNYHYKECTFDGCESVSEKDTHVFSDDSCSVCGYKEEESPIIVTSGTVTNVIANAQDGDTILLKGGTYSNITIEGVENLTIKAEEGAVITKITVKSGVKNLCLNGLTFYSSDSSPMGGVFFEDFTDGVIVRNCAFSGNVQIQSPMTASVQNVHVINTSFKDLIKTNLSSIIICQVDNLTVKDCSFINIAYNALQVGNKEISGNITVKDNLFKDIASRVLYFVNPKGVISSDISGNTFGDNSACNKTTGHYVKAGDVGINVGANKWEIIPEPTETNFDGIESGNIIYNASEQTVVSLDN